MGVKASPKKTEYTKQYKGPRWADRRFVQLWEDNVDYRVQRRRVEHSHTPWHWELWDGDTDSGSDDGAGAGRRPQTALPNVAANEEEQNGLPADQKRDQEVQTPERWERDRTGDFGRSVPGQGHDAGDIDVPPRQTVTKPTQAHLGKTRVISTKAKPARPVSAPVRRRLPPQRPPLNPPFLPYGQGDRERITGDKRTFNVRASVRNNEEVYLSALRALRRREMQVKAALEARRRDAQRQVALSRSRSVPPHKSDSSQWRTEYQSNFQHN